MMMRAGSLIQFIHMTSTWPGLRYCPDTCLEEQRDTANYFSHASRLLGKVCTRYLQTTKLVRYIATLYR